jgi:DNA (cytosine-5)-methyltransferase 1
MAHGQGARSGHAKDGLITPVVGAICCNTGSNGHGFGGFLNNQAVDAGHILACTHEAPIVTHTLRGGGLGTDFDCDGGVITMAHGQGGAEIGFDRGPTLTCNHEAPIVAFPASLSGTQCASTENLSPGLGAMNPAAVAFGIPGNGIGRKPENGGNAVEPMMNVSPCQTKTDRHGVAVCFQQNTRDEVRLIGGEGNLAGALAASAGMKQTNYIAQATAFEPGLLKREGTHFYHEHTGVIRSDPGDNAMAAAITFDAYNQAAGPVTHTLRKGRSATGDEIPIMFQSMHVRRLTPRECERLQGFPDDHTLVPHRGKPAADGPRYKSLGNSWAVPVVAWIGKRIHNHLKEQV